MTQRRLIEEAFPLKKVSEDSKHEKNVRHGHISTLHIWPARRPLAACRAALIAALIPDPGDEAGRHELNKQIESITHWGSENGLALDYFRKEIRKAYGGRAPRVLDPFAGGGAIPLEAMRLGCEVIANDYNPVAWFILKCTLEFPQRLAGKTWPLPSLPPDGGEPEGGQNLATETGQMRLLDDHQPQMGDLAAHVRYWGEWVLARAREELAPYYPTVDGQQTVAYLWARTVPCPDPACGAEVPLLKTLWLCTKAEKTLPDTPENRARPDFLRIKRYRGSNTRVIINGRRALRLVPNPDEKRVDFEVWTPGPRDYVPPGTMAGSKSRCPVCGVNIPNDYIKECGTGGKLGTRMTAVAVDTDGGKAYRLPTREDDFAIESAADELPQIIAEIPDGLPSEPLPGKDRHRAVGSQLPDYGFETWDDIFIPRQLLALAVFGKWTRSAYTEMKVYRYPDEWVNATQAYLGLAFDRFANYTSTLSIWSNSGEEIKQTFLRFALAMSWDFAESCPILLSGRYYAGALDNIERVLVNLLEATQSSPFPSIMNHSATSTEFVSSVVLGKDQRVDVVVTDPPYYDAIPYADLSDFFYVWLKRIIGDGYSHVFGGKLTPKTNELTQQHKSGDRGRKGKARYETGMSEAFDRVWEILEDNGHMVIVFAHKDPDAWETLLSAMIRSGFTVTASWPIDTEMQSGVRSQVASLASSVWLICRKRIKTATVGRYAAVRRAMQERVTERLRYFWDVGISGPDFVWAAVGPALESYSAYDEVRRLDGSPFTVGEFLREVRRMVADFSLGQILKGRSTEGLDEWTRYYLMHRDFFGLSDAPVGECILLSQGYGLDLNDLRGPRGIMVNAAGSNVRLARWDERTHDSLGEPHSSGILPMIDVLHRLMHLWAAGNLDALNDYAAEKGLPHNDLFWAVAQAVLEMADAKSRERTLLEAVVAWGRGKPLEEPQITQQRLIAEN